MPKRRVSVDYAEYMQSPEWAAKRLAAIKHYGAICQWCRDLITGTIWMHHRRYTHLGNEPMEDLAPVCEDCHPQADDERMIESAARSWRKRCAGYLFRKYGLTPDEITRKKWMACSRELRQWRLMQAGGAEEVPPAAIRTLAWWVDDETIDDVGRLTKIERKMAKKYRTRLRAGQYRATPPKEHADD